MKKLLVAIGALLFVGAFGSASAHALNARTGDAVDVAKGQVIESSYYVAGKQIDIAGTVKGDVYCAGQDVEISGVVEGDVLCAAQQVRITGQVQGNIRAAAQTITVTGHTTGSASLIGQTITLEDTASIGRDLTVTGQTLRLGGKVARDVVGVTNSATIAAQIGRDVDFAGDTTVVRDTAKIGRNFTYTSNNTADIDKGAVILGATQRKTPPQKPVSKKPEWVKRITSPLYWFAVFLIAGSLFLLLVPRWFKKTATTMQKRALASVGLGLAGMVVTPIAAVVLMVTVVGIPFGIAFLLFWIAVALLSMVFVAYALGSWITGYLHWLEKGREFAAVLIGILVTLLLINLPYIGNFLAVGGLIWGMGGVYLALSHSVRMQHQPEKVAKHKK